MKTSILTFTLLFLSCLGLQASSVNKFRETRQCIWPYTFKIPQARLIRNGSAYLEKYYVKRNAPNAGPEKQKRELKKAQKRLINKKGGCLGLSVLWGLLSNQGYGRAWKEELEAIAHWDPKNDAMTPALAQTFERFMQDVGLIQNPNENRSLLGLKGNVSQMDALEATASFVLNKRIKGSSFLRVKKHLSAVVRYCSRDNYLRLLKKIVKNENHVYLLMSWGIHGAALLLRHDASGKPVYVYYDPNKGVSEYRTLEELADKGIRTSLVVHFHNNPRFPKGVFGAWSKKGLGWGFLGVTVLSCSDVDADKEPRSLYPSVDKIAYGIFLEKFQTLTWSQLTFYQKNSYKNFLMSELASFFEMDPGEAFAQKFLDVCVAKPDFSINKPCTQESESLIVLAAKQGYFNIVKWLLSKGARVASADRNPEKSLLAKLNYEARPKRELLNAILSIQRKQLGQVEYYEIIEAALNKIDKHKKPYFIVGESVVRMDASEFGRKMDYLKEIEAFLRKELSK